MESLGTQERALQLEVPPIAPEPPGGGHDPVTRHVGPAALAHDRAHGARRPRMARGLRDIAVRRDATRRDAPDDGEDAGGERGRARQC